MVGTITDGDIRRGLLNGLNVNSSIQKITNYMVEKILKTLRMF